MKLYDGGMTFILFALLFGWGVSVAERAKDETNTLHKAAVKEVVDHDIDETVKFAKKEWKNKTPLDYSKLNK